MEIKTVRADDVYEDEANPRSDFGDLKALAESFALNKMRPGQPVNPPVVVRDGGIYRIVDGARRFRAMQILTECETLITKMDEQKPSDTATQTPTPQDDAEKRAQAMLKALCTPQSPAKTDSGRHGALWIFIMLAVLAGMTFLSWLMLNRMTH